MSIQTQTYTAITLGPLVGTILSARSTKAVWASSYLFSWIMRQLMDVVHQKEDCQIILPHYDPDLDTSLRAGLFPDKCIIKGDCLILLQQAKEQLISDLANRVYSDLSNEAKTQGRLVQFYNEPDLKDQVKSYLSDYLRINVLKADVLESENESKVVNEYLDTSELLSKPMMDAEVDFLNILMEEVYYNFLVKERYYGAFKYFPSTAEIATYGFNGRPDYKEAQKILRDSEGIKNKREDSDDSQTRFYQSIKKSFPKEFRNHHKYIAIVHGDGDNFGSIIQAINNQENAEILNLRFSEKLDQFRTRAVKSIQDWDAVPIYGSGDDLLFFSPIAKPFEKVEESKSLVKETIFDILDQIDLDFKESILEDPEMQPALTTLKEKGGQVPSLSFGMSIGYYKYPLNESISKSYELLNEKAKLTPGKNTISFQVTKHSGQFFGTDFRIQSLTFNAFRKLFGKDGEMIPDEKLLRSIAYKLNPLEPLLLAIGQSNQSIRNEQMTNLFKHHFNESIHLDKDKELNAFLKNVLHLLQEIYSENPIKKDKEDEPKLITSKNQQNIHRLYAALRFISFIFNKEERDEF